MRRFLVICLLGSSCVLPEIDLSRLLCDATHPCANGWACVEGTCLACTDHDGDGELPTACGGRDCDDAARDVHPAATEACANGLDDDCNGRKDGEDESCRCEADTERPCEGGCPGTVARCVDGVFGACVAPAETCNGEDDDCNGETDEGGGRECVLGASEACTLGCGAPGTRTCASGCGWGPCVAVEECNGADDDCDDVADEGFSCVRGASSACITSCGTTGAVTCGSDCGPGACLAPAETCNGVDDDCVGGVDDGLASAPVAALGTLSAVAVAARDGFVAHAVVTSSDGEDTVALALDPPGGVAGAGPRVTLPARAESQPREVEVGVGGANVLVAWTDGRSGQAYVAVVSRTGEVVAQERVLEQVDAGTHLRVAWTPADGGRFAVSWIASQRARIAVFSEQGTTVLASRTVGAALHAGARLVGLAASPSGLFLVGAPVTAADGSMRPEVVELAADGAQGEALMLSSSVAGLLRDEGFELASSTDTVVAAWSVVQPGSGGNERTVVATSWRSGAVPSPAVAVSPAGAPVGGLVRLAAQPGGHAVTWMELLATGDVRHQAAVQFDGGATRVHRVDEAGGAYVPSSPFGTAIAFDGALYRFAWPDGGQGIVRALCP